MREVGAELRLSATGKFKFAMAYGGTDSSAAGRWTLDGNLVKLTTDPMPNASLKLGELMDTMIEPFASDTQKPSLLVVHVTSPQLGMTWSNMQVTAHFSNGLQRSGSTSPQGLGFLARSDGPWSGATIQSVSVGYERGKVAPIHIRVEPGKTKTVIVHFDPGSLAAPAFHSLELQVDRSGSDEVSLVRGEGVDRWAFTRR